MVVQAGSLHAYRSIHSLHKNDPVSLFLSTETGYTGKRIKQKIKKIKEAYSVCSLTMIYSQYFTSSQRQTVIQGRNSSVGRASK